MPTPIRVWKLRPADKLVLAALEKAGIGKDMTDRVRLGLRALAREKGVKYDEPET